MNKQNLSFRVGGPILEPAHFIGRNNLLNVIIYAMKHLQNISLRGERRTGKTSILRYLAHPDNIQILGFDETHLLVYFNFQEVPQSPANEIWAALSKAIADQLTQKHPDKQPQADEFLKIFQPYLDVGTNIATGLSYAMVYLKSEGFTLHLLFDEFERTAKNDYLGDFFYDILRSLPYRTENLSYVIATRTGLAALQPRYNKLSSPFFNIFTGQTIPPFTRDEARTLIFDYFLVAGIDLSVAEKLWAQEKELYHVTGYHPFFLQAFCYHLGTQLDQPAWPLEASWQYALERLTYDAEEHFQYYWRVSHPHEREVMKHLAADKHLKPHKVQTLKDRCLVVIDAAQAQPPRLFSSLFVNWVNNQLLTQIFLIAHDDDEARVEHIYKQLSEAGFNPWWAKKNVLPGERQQEKREEALFEADFVLVCFSQKMLQEGKRWQHQVEQALSRWQRDLLERDIYIIPVKLEAVDLPPNLRNIVPVELFTSNQTQGLAHLLAAIQREVASAPPRRRLSVRPRSYIEREADKQCLALLTDESRKTILLRAPRGSGKTALIEHFVRQINQQGVYQPVVIDLKVLFEGLPPTEDDFYQKFVTLIRREFQLPPWPDDYWATQQTNVQRCTHYLTTYVRPALGGKRLFLIIDSLEEILLHNIPFQTEFLSMFRGWHHERDKEIFQGMKLLFSSAVEPDIFLQEPRRSPFNIVSTYLQMTDFNQTEVKVLYERYNKNPSNKDDMEQHTEILFKWLGGHPALTHKILLLMKAQIDWADFSNEATISQVLLQQTGPLQEEWAYYDRILANHENSRALNYVLRYQRFIPDELNLPKDQHPIYNRLKGLGLVKDTGERLLFRNELYKQYFKMWLEANPLPKAEKRDD